MALLPCASIPALLDDLGLSRTGSVSVGEMLLPGMTAFARVFNPAQDRYGAPVRWDRISGHPIDGNTQWGELAAAAGADVANISPPESGGLNPAVAVRLVEQLRTRTGTPDDCYFFVWEGYAGLRPELAEAVTIDLAPFSRRMHVLRGSVDDATESVETRPGSRLSLWWVLADGAWSLGNDIYGRSVFVAGTEELVARIVADPGLEAHAVNPGTLVVAEDF